MRVAVIGRGLIGSAAARHLARAGQDVVLIGPEEPRDKRAHRGVFGSHYDAGRITRRIDPDPFWARVSAESIARYGEIADEGGVEFYTESGVIFSGPATHPEIVATQEVARLGGYDCDPLEGTTLAGRFPALEFEPGTRALFEGRHAGHINPRAMVRAQANAARRAGARVVDATALGLAPDGVRTGQGVIEADQVLVAAGGFSAELLGNQIAPQVFGRTILLARLGVSEVARLRDVPPVIHYFADGGDIYLVPPVRYPDGDVYLKIGGDLRDVPLQDAEIGDWFRAGGDGETGEALEARLRGLFPGLRIEACHLEACVTTYTQTQLPLLRRLSERVSVATAGCGRGAKCSDELGRLGAEVALGRGLPVWAEEAGLHELG